MPAMNGPPHRWARWVGAAILLLAGAAFGLVCLWAGMKLGVLFVRTGSSFIGSPSMTAWLPEELRGNVGGVLSALPMVAAVLAAMRSGLPAWFAQFASGVVQFVNECLKLPTGRHSWFGLPGRPGLLPSFAAPCLILTVAGFLLGSYAAAPTEPSRPAVTYVFSSDSMLSILPIHPLVHFENAELGADGKLTGRGTTLNDARKGALTKIVEALRPCAAADRSVTIKPYGFASDDPFLVPGVDSEDSDRLNVDAANRRARAVHKALDTLIEREAGMTVEAPIVWETFERMQNERNSMIRVPEGAGRDPFADRVVLLRLPSTGVCMRS